MNTLENLTGSLLVAHPCLLDPNFRRTIVFISEHSKEDGATGFVLNRRLEEFLPNLPEASVYYGGPVGSDEMLLTSLQWRENPAMVAFRAFVGPLDADSFKGWESGLRVFAGYSGWMPGQLENEIAENTWLVIPPTRDLIMATNPCASWHQFMKNSGPLLHLLSEAPDNPSLN